MGGACLILAPDKGSAQALQADSERNFPGILAPIYQFGQVGAEPGRLRSPAGVAVGPDDLLYLADAGNHRIEIFTLNGLLRGVIGELGSGPGQFRFPSAVSVSPDGELFVADPGNGRIQEFSPRGKFVREWGGLRAPLGLAAALDRVYVSDALTHRVHFFSRVNGASGNWGGWGTQPGQFNEPVGVALDELGFLYVADRGNHRIQKFDRDGKPVAHWGVWGAQAGLMSYPSGLGYAKERLYLADRCNHRVQVFSRDGDFLQQWGSAPALVGQSAGRLHFPEGLAVGPAGGMTVITEPLENRIQVFVNRDAPKLTRVNDLPWWDSLHARSHAARLAPPPPGAKPQRVGALASPDVHAIFFFDVTTEALGPIAGVGGFGRKLGEFNGIGGLAVEPESGKIYVSDPGNRRVVLLQLVRDPARPDIFSRSVRMLASYSMERLAPTGLPGYKREQALPGPLCLGPEGRLYLLDRANSVILVCGDGMQNAGAVAVSPTLGDFTVGPGGEIYATDPAQFLVRIYGVDGRQKTAWGRHDDQIEGGFLLPSGITLDDQGFVYVSDTLGNRIEKFDSGGRFIARWGTPGTALQQLSAPRSIQFERPDRLVVEETGAHRAQVFGLKGEWMGVYVGGGLSTPLVIR